jgi:hypothetical protein
MESLPSNVPQQDPPAPGSQDGSQPLTNDCSMEPLPSNVVSGDVGHDPLVLGLQDGSTSGDGWQTLIIADSSMESLPSDAISYALGAEGRDTPTHADGQQDPPALSDQDSCMESMSLGAMPDADADEGESDLFEQLDLTYGCTNPLGLVLATASSLDWRGVLMALGIVKDPAKFLSKSDMNAITVFISRLSSKRYGNLPRDLDTLNPHNHLSISGTFEFRDVRRVKDLFIFDIRRSSACSWTLGVGSAAAALYICRYILTNPVAHTTVTVAHRLLKKGIRFRTLILLPANDDVEPLSAKTKPLFYRKLEYRYTPEDFEGSMLTCKGLLKSPHGRAALLRGGIVGRIAREFLSIDAALDGPSVEVTKHRAGFMSPSHMRRHYYGDDDLSDQEIDIICGTYVLWTGESR